MGFAKAGDLAVLSPGKTMNHARSILVGLTVVLLPSCSPMNGSQSGDGDLAECWPPSADNYDAGVGCSASPEFNVCQVSNGATILPDGGVINGTEVCTDFCSPSEYSLICRGGMSENCYELAVPRYPIGCTIVPVPTPACTLVYCCPCSP